jgi:hypothetical protein
MEFTCPLTLEVMVDPVVDPDGNTYERSAIEEWLAQHAVSPLTRRPLTADQLVPNRMLRSMLEAQNGSTSSPATKTQAWVKPASDGFLEVTAVPSIEPQADVQFALSRCEAGEGKDEGNEVVTHVLVTDQVELPEPHPCHVCVVIDVSGSMGSEATAKDGEGNALESGFTLLNLVQHATKTIVHTLRATDSLSIVTFSDNASVVLSRRLMDEAGKRHADSLIDGLHPQCTTNLWAGINAGIDQVTGELDRFTSIFVLTDGQPSNRNLDYVGALRRKLAQCPVNGSISFFGFGYCLDSLLLKNLSVEGDGSFGLIPDAGFVGTIFICAMANFRTVFAVDAAIEFNESALAVAPLRQRTPTSVSIGSLRYGQSLAFVFKATEGVQARLVYTLLNGRKVVIEAESMSPSVPERDEYYRQRSRIVAEMLQGAGRPYSNTLPQQLAPPAVMAASKFPEMMALHQDIAGEVAQAVASKSAYNRWGKHYLFSLAMAHLFSVCNNFKDPGVQVYGGALFKHMQEQMNDLFMNLPPPPQSTRARARVRAGHAPVSYASLNRSSNVCFHPDTLLMMADGHAAPISSVKRGDLVMVSEVESAEVITVTVSECDTAPLMVALSETLVVTPYHPVRRLDGPHSSKLWEFPGEIAESQVYRSVQAVYNLMLSNGHTVLTQAVDGTGARFECATLGHGFTQDKVRHGYFGSEAIRRDLMLHEDAPVGVIRIKHEDVRRDPVTLEIISIVGDRGTLMSVQSDATPCDA